MLKCIIPAIIISITLWSCSSNSPANEPQDEKDLKLRQEFTALVDSATVWAEQETADWDEVEATYQRLNKRFLERTDSMDTMTKQGIQKLQRKYSKLIGMTKGKEEALRNNVTLLVNDLSFYMDSLKQTGKARIDKLGDEAKEDLQKEKTFIEENYEILADTTQARYNNLKEELKKFGL